MTTARWAPWLASRLATALVTLAVMSVVVFWATEVLPGDAVGVLSGPDATDAERAAMRTALGLDRPAVDRYLDWISGAFRGDLGTSLVSGRDVTEIVGRGLRTSLTVLLPAVSLITALAGTFGIIAGLRRGGRVDRVLSATTLGLVGTPDFLLATALLAVFTVWWPVVPAVAIVPTGQSLAAHPELVVLPAAALALGAFGSTMRILRATVAQVTVAPFAEFSRLNGVRRPRYVWTITSNALGPAVHALAVMTAGLLGGAIVVETLFNVPGLGHELTGAVANRDIPLIQGLGLVLGASTLAILLGGDMVTRILDRHSIDTAAGVS